MIKIWRSEKDKQWYVHHTSKNGKILCASEGFRTRANAVKNIKAMGKIYGADFVSYFDTSRGVYTITGCP